MPGLLAVVLVLSLASVILGADPTTVPAETTSVPAEATAAPLEVLEGGDLRSEGEGPGLVGNPLLILLAVVALGAATVGVTVLLVRLSQRD